MASNIVIGFLNTSYVVNESDGLVNIQIGIINQGFLRVSVEVKFSISLNQSVTGKPYVVFWCQIIVLYYAYI